MKIDLTYPRKFIAVRSSVVPEGYSRATYNDLACHHASRGADGMLRRMKAYFLETISEI
jgi:hypothetical protein